MRWRVERKEEEKEAIKEPKKLDNIEHVIVR